MALAHVMGIELQLSAPRDTLGRPPLHLPTVIPDKLKLKAGMLCPWPARTPTHNYSRQIKTTLISKHSVHMGWRN